MPGTGRPETCNDLYRILGKPRELLYVGDKSAVLYKPLHEFRIRRELELFAVCNYHAFFKVDFYLVAHADGIDRLGADDDRKSFVETVAIVDAREALGDDDCNAALLDACNSLFAAGSAAPVLASDDYVARFAFLLNSISRSSRATFAMSARSLIV